MAENNLNDNILLNRIYFGEIIGYKEIYQLNELEYYNKCLKENSLNNDFTDLRLYSGSNVFIRFLERYFNLFNNLNICEIGCGVGLVSLCCGILSKPNYLLLTDGNNEAIEIAKLNINKFELNNIANAKQLLWTSSIIEESNQFDIIIGCELMYYKLDMPLLFAMVQNLLKSNGGLFYHAHIFRKDGQENELYTLLLEMNWKSLEIEIPIFVSEIELSEHPDWFNVRCFVSGPIEKIDELNQVYPEWKVFLGKNGKGTDGEDENENDNNPFGNLDVF